MCITNISEVHEQLQSFLVDVVSNLPQSGKL